MGVHSVKKTYPWKSIILWGFWSKTDFSKKKRSKLISDLQCRRCVWYIRHVFFMTTDVWALSEKNLSRFKEPFWWFLYYYLLLSYRVPFIKIEDDNFWNFEKRLKFPIFWGLTFWQLLKKTAAPGVLKMVKYPPQKPEQQVSTSQNTSQSNHDLITAC